jgi:plastocyanin
MFKRFFCVLFCLSSANSFANKVDVQVVGPEGVGLANAVISLQPTEPLEQKDLLVVAIMDQVDTKFLPHILTVQKNSLVRFPNSDSIKHHVYSFSSAKMFELQLYKGLQADPLLFSKIGVVELGCNVHDWMIGYIYVVDTPYFTQTDKDGKGSVTLPNGNYQINVWHPRIKDKSEDLSSQLMIDSDLTKTVRIKGKLSPMISQFENGNDEFSDYE